MPLTDEYSDQMQLRNSGMTLMNSYHMMALSYRVNQRSINPLQKWYRDIPLLMLSFFSPLFFGDVVSYWQNLRK